MKLVDCFPYFNEEEHLILRINLLQDYVDKFVICEANRTHTGTLKEYTVEQVLRKHNLPLDKIHIHKVELPSKEEQPDDWVRERKQRDEAAKLMEEGEIWFVSDCDEIVDPQYLGWYKTVVTENQDTILRPRMAFLIGESTLQLFYKGNPVYWDAAFFAHKRHTERYTLSEIRELVSWNTNGDFPEMALTKDGEVLVTGWHLSWMGSSERRVQKLEAFMHYEDSIKNGIGYLNTQEAKDYVKNFIPAENGVDVLKRDDHTLQKYDIDQLPSLILQNRKLREFFLPSYSL